jgi:DNA-binding transcriptional LysR family regulator
MEAIRRTKVGASDQVPDAAALELFARVVAAGSLAAAAKRLGQTRAAVSRRLAQIERRIGQPLLVRTTRSLALTETGRRLLAPAMAVLDSADQARGILRSVNAGLAGRLRITALPSFGSTVLLPLLARFRALNPGVHYDLLFCHRRVDLVKEGVDIAFRVTRRVPLDWVARRFRPFRVSAYAPPSLFASPLANPADLAQLPLLLLTGAEIPQPMRWRRIGDPAASRASRGADALVPSVGPGAVQADDLLSLVSLAEQGAGVVLAPDYCVAGAVAAGRLLELLPDWHLPIPQGQDVQLLTVPVRQLGPAARAFVAFALAERDRV